LPYLDYLVPDKYCDIIRPGQMLIAPFRSKDFLGLVIGLRTDTSIQGEKMKEISSFICPEQFISENIIEYNKEIADFYRASLGFVLKSALPPLQKRKLAKVAETIKTMPLQKKQQPQKPTFIAYNSQEELAKNIEKIASGYGQRLILVPEIYQIGDIRETVIKTEGIEPIIITSDLSEKDFFDRWFAVRNDENAIVIGTRKALFLPWVSLTTILVTDEGNSAYKSWDMAPRYHARDAAIMLAKHTGSKIYLLSAAPSIETYYFTKNKIYDGFTALKNISNPTPIFCNVKAEKRGGNISPLTEEIIQNFRDLKSGAFILVSRKATAAAVMCHDCHYIFKCDNCRRTNAYHKKTNQISCHFCRQSRPLPATCPSCGGVDYFLAGLGTEGIAEAVRRIVDKDTAILVVDSENPINQENFILSGKTIIIGTEFAWPYLNWEHLETIVIADADSALISAEFRNTEDLWQTIRRIQLKARPGTNFYIQTTDPEQAVFAGVYDPAVFYEAALTERKIFGYPPYNYLIRAYYGSENKLGSERTAMEAVNRLNTLTKKTPDVKILGPISAFPPFYRGRFWQVILIKLSYSNYKMRAKELLSVFSEEWKIDPNPNNIISIS